MENITIKEWLKEKEKYKDQIVRNIKSISLVNFKPTQIEQEFPLKGFMRLETLEVNNIVFFSIFQEISQDKLKKTIFSREIPNLEKITIVEKPDSSNNFIEDNLGFYQDIFNQYHQVENKYQEYLEILELNNLVTGGVFKNFEITLDVKKMRVDFRSKDNQEKIINTLKYCKLVVDRSLLTNYNGKNDCIENLNKKLEENKKEKEQKVNDLKKTISSLRDNKVNSGKQLAENNSKLDNNQREISELKIENSQNKKEIDLLKESEKLNQQKNNQLINDNKELLKKIKELEKWKEQQSEYLESLGNSQKGQTLNKIRDLELEKKSLEERLNQLFKEFNNSEKKEMMNRRLTRNYDEVIVESNKGKQKKGLTNNSEKIIKKLEFQVEYFKNWGATLQNDLIEILTDDETIKEYLKSLKKDGKEEMKKLLENYYSRLSIEMAKAQKNKEQKQEARIEEQRSAVVVQKNKIS